MYMSEIGRWNGVDPLAELDFDKTSFHYVSNNPINRIDPTGCKDCDNNGSDDGDCFNGGTFEEVTISAKKPTISIGILGYIAKYIDSFDPLGLENHYKYLEKHGNDESWKKVKSSFREGGNIAAGVASAPILLIGAAEGVGYLGSARLVGLLRNSIHLQTNWGAGIGDLASQLQWNGGDIRDVNLLSVAGQTFIGGKLSPIINSTAAFFKFSLENRWQKTFKTENLVEFGANIIGNSLSSIFESGIPQQTAKVAKNLYSGVANFLFGNISNPIIETYKENNEKK